MCISLVFPKVRTKIIKIKHKAPPCLREAEAFYFYLGGHFEDVRSFFAGLHSETLEHSIECSSRGFQSASWKGLFSRRLFRWLLPDYYRIINNIYFHLSFVQMPHVCGKYSTNSFVELARFRGLTSSWTLIIGQPRVILFGSCFGICGNSSNKRQKPSAFTPNA